MADAIVAAVAAAPIAPGGMTLQDLAGYAVKERAPVCVPYRGYKICGMGPPSSGGPTVAQALKLVEPFDLGQGAEAALRPQALHLIALCFRQRQEPVSMARAHARRLSCLFQSVAGVLPHRFQQPIPRLALFLLRILHQRLLHERS